MVSYITQIANNRDWTKKSLFKNSLIDLMGAPFIYEERDKIDDILLQNYPDFQNEVFPIIDSVNVDLFRQLAFIEGIDFLFRAINFCQAIQYLLINGFYSPAQSMSYQAAFYCARSILGLSGVYCSEIKSKDFILDVYYNQNQSINEYCINSVRRNHQVMWNLLAKVIQISIVDDFIVEKSIFNILKGVNYASCSNLRHHIHYYNKYNFIDLFNKKEYESYLIDLIDLETINNNCDYFDLLCLFLIFSSNLFLSIAMYSQGLEDMIKKYKILLRKEDNEILVKRHVFDKIKGYDSI